MTIKPKTIRLFIDDECRRGDPVTGTTVDEAAWDIHKRLQLHPSSYHKLREAMQKLVNHLRVVIDGALVRTLSDEEREEMLKERSNAHQRERARRHTFHTRCGLVASHRVTLAWYDGR